MSKFLEFGGICYAAISFYINVVSAQFTTDNGAHVELRVKYWLINVLVNIRQRRNKIRLWKISMKNDSI